ncbi:MAG TPA: hypothetical protein VL463_30875 [Kofleriaceae bacterium]|nr:hypothetical protein [Kofleriaceae bacterium]
MKLAIILIAALATRAAAGPSVRTQVILSDGFSDALIVTGPIVDQADVSKIGLFGALLGAPIVHAANDGWARAGWSLLARTTMPIGGIGAGGLLCNALTTRQPDEWFHCLDWELIGAGLGLLGAEVLDATVISRPSDPTDPTPTMFTLTGVF